jgi:hypothetical protein
MAARPDCVLIEALIRPKTVVTTPVVKGRVVSLNTSDGQCVHTAAAGLGFGVALESGAVGESIPVYLLAGAGIVPVVVGTGGATRGLLAAVVADGVTNSGTASAVGAAYTCGFFTQSGVAGDIVGMVPLPGLLPTDAA